MFQFGETTIIQRCANRGIEILGLRRSCKAARKPSSEQRQRQNLHSILTMACSSNPTHVECEGTLDYDGLPLHRLLSRSVGFPLLLKASLRFTWIPTGLYVSTISCCSVRHRDRR